jgi:hypothetical protein
MQTDIFDCNSVFGYIKQIGPCEKLDKLFQAKNIKRDIHINIKIIKN